MIILDTDQKSLEIVTDSSNATHWTCHWTNRMDPCTNIVGESDEEDQGIVSSATTTTISSAPPASTPTVKYSKRIEFISLYNAGMSESNVTIQINKNGTPVIVYYVNLLTGHQMIYNEDSGIQVFDEKGIPM